MSNQNEFVEADTGSKLEVTCKNDADQSVIDLTGATVKIRWNNAASVLQERNMTITNAAAGVAEYQFASGELEKGRVSYEIEITDSGGGIIKCLNLLPVLVREKLA